MIAAVRTQLARLSLRSKLVGLYLLFGILPVMLLAGDKAKGTSRLKWSRWYRKAVPEAERLFARHLEEGEDR